MTERTSSLTSTVKRIARQFVVPEGMPSVPPIWRRWVAENLLVGASEESLVGALQARGVTARVAADEIRGVASDPCFQMAQVLWERMQHAESLLDVRHHLEGLSADHASVPQQRNLSRRDFLERYYAANRPVVLLGYADGWRANALWSLDYLRAKLREVEVEVLAGRESDPKFESNSDAHRQTVPFGDFVDWVATTDVSNDRYLSAKNRFLMEKEAAPLWNDFPYDTEYLNGDPAVARDKVHLWLGPRGTFTPLHADAFNGLLVQIRGRKRVTLISPLQAHVVHNNIDDTAEVDCDDPALATQAWFSALNRLEVTLQPGQAVFIPVGWLHQVRSLDVSVSLSFTNFCFPNDYQWHPHGISPR